jgi:hypothetical protein
VSSPTSLGGSGSSSSGQTGGGSNGYAGLWSPAASYTAGNTVYVAPGTNFNGATGSSGVYFNITGTNGGYPPADGQDWLFLGGNTPVFQQASSGTLTNVSILNGSTTSTFPVTIYLSAPTTFTKLSISSSTPLNVALLSNGAEVSGLFFQITDQTTGQYAYCLIGDSGVYPNPSETNCNENTTINGIGGEGNSGPALVISPNDQLVLQLTSVYSATALPVGRAITIAQVTWALN